MQCSCFSFLCFCLPPAELLEVVVDGTITATEDEAVNIPCTVTGNPIPQKVTWIMKNTSDVEFKLESGTSYLLSSKPEKDFTRVFTLTIKEPTLEMNDSQYSCSAFDRIDDKSVPSGIATLLVAKKG